MMDSINQQPYFSNEPSQASSSKPGFAQSNSGLDPESGNSQERLKLADRSAPTDFSNDSWQGTISKSSLAGVTSPFVDGQSEAPSQPVGKWPPPLKRQPNANPGPSTLTLPSGLQLTQAQIQQYRDLTHRLTQLNGQPMTQEVYDHIAGRLKTERRKIAVSAFKNSENGRKVETLSSQIEDVDNRLKKGETLSSQDLMEHLNCQAKRELLYAQQTIDSNELDSQFTRDDYNRAMKLGIPLSPGQLRDFNNMTTQTPENPEDILKNNLTMQTIRKNQELLKAKMDLEPKVLSGKATPEEREKYHQLSYLQHTQIDHPEPQPYPLNAQVRADIRGGFKMDGSVPADAILKYFNPGSIRSTIKNESDQGNAGEAIDLAKKAKTNGGKLELGDSKRLRQLMFSRFDPKDLRGMNFEGQEMSDSHYEDVQTAGAKFNGAKFLKGSYIENAKLFPVGHTRINADGSPITDKSLITDFSNAEMEDAHFINVDGDNARFNKTQMPGATFYGGHFNGTDFRNANLHVAEVRGGNFDRSNFGNATLDGMRTFDKTSFQQAVFQETSMDGFNRANKFDPETDFTGAVLKNTNARDGNFRGCKFTESIIDNTDFGGCNKFQRSDFSGADFSNAIIHRSSFNGANFDSKTNFKNAYMPYNSFEDARFNQSELPGAILHGIKALHAQFNGSNLSGADLFQAEMEGAKFNPEGAKKTNLANASLQKVKASGAEFREANMVGANLLDGDFHNADFRGAQMQGVNIQGANLDSIKFDTELTGEQSQFYGAIYDDKTTFPGIGSLDEEGRAKFAKKYGMYHVEQVDRLRKAAQVKEQANNLKDQFSAIVQGGTYTDPETGKKTTIPGQGWGSATYDYVKNNASIKLSKGSDEIMKKFDALVTQSNKLQQLANEAYTPKNRYKFEKAYFDYYGYSFDQHISETQQKRTSLIEKFKNGTPEEKEAAKREMIDLTKSDYDHMGGKLKDALEGMNTFTEDQQAFGEGLSMAAGMGVFLAATMMTPVLGPAALCAAPLVSAGVETLVDATNGKGDGTRYSGEDLATKASISVGVGYATLPLAGLGKLASKRSGVVLTRVGERLIGRTLTPAGEDVAAKMIGNQLAHAGNGATYSFVHTATESMVYDGSDLETALIKGAKSIPTGAAMGVGFGNAFDAIGAKAHKGYQTWQRNRAWPPVIEKSASTQPKPLPGENAFGGDTIARRQAEEKIRTQGGLGPATQDGVTVTPDPPFQPPGFGWHGHDGRSQLPPGLKVTPKTKTAANTPPGKKAEQLAPEEQITKLNDQIGQETDPQKRLDLMKKRDKLELGEPRYTNDPAQRDAESQFREDIKAAQQLRNEAQDRLNALDPSKPGYKEALDELQEIQRELAHNRQEYQKSFTPTASPPQGDGKIHVPLGELPSPKDVQYTKEFARDFQDLSKKSDRIREQMQEVFEDLANGNEGGTKVKNMSGVLEYKIDQQLRAYFTQDNKGKIVLLRMHYKTSEKENHKVIESARKLAESY